jgi:hypothetical protein
MQNQIALGERSNMQNTIVTRVFVCCALVIVLASVSSVNAAGPMSIRMTAATASDPSGVAYYFDETSENDGGSDSVWQDSPFYRDKDLLPDTEYTYRSKARDKSFNLNETEWSDPESVTTGNPMDKLADFILHWLEPGCGDPNWCDGGDRTSDGFVGAEDLAIFATANWLEFNLKGYWKFNDSPFDSSAFDCSGYIRAGSLIGDANFVPDPQRGQVLSLDGDGDCVQITGYKGVTGLTTRTVSAWIKTSMAGAGDIISWGQETEGNRWLLYIGGDGGLRIAVYAGYKHTTSMELRDGTWHHVAAVLPMGYINVADVELYVDGELIGPEDTTSSGRQIDTIDIADVKIGILDDGQNRYFDGLIDDVRIYNRALSETEIAALAGL